MIQDRILLQIVRLGLTEPFVPARFASGVLFSGDRKLVGFASGLFPPCPLPSTNFRSTHSSTRLSPELSPLSGSSLSFKVIESPIVTPLAASASGINLVRVARAHCSDSSNADISAPASSRVRKALLVRRVRSLAPLDAGKTSLLLVKMTRFCASTSL